MNSEERRAAAVVMATDGPCVGGHLTDAAMRKLLEGIRNMTPEQYADLWDRAQSRENIGSAPAPAAPADVCQCGHWQGAHVKDGGCLHWIDEAERYCKCCKYEPEPPTPPAAPLPCPTCIEYKAGPKPGHKSIGDACIAYRHDFGLLTVDEQARVRDEALNWWRAWQIARRAPCPECAKLAMLCTGHEKHSDALCAKLDAAEALVAAISAEYADVRRQSATSEARIAGALAWIRSTLPCTLSPCIDILEGRADASR